MSVAQQLAKSSFETLRLDVTDSVLTITISRPEALNALSQQVLTELHSVIGALREQLGTEDPAGTPDWSIRGVIITGDGEKSFVAGGDIAQMNQQTGADTRDYTGTAQQLTLWIEELPVPVIAAVNGYALGGGTEFALACDMIFAVETASFGQPEVALGLIPGFGGTVRLQQVVGPQLAKDLIMSGRRISAREAHEIGLASRLFATQEELLQGARDYVHLVSKQSPIAVAAAKRTMNRVAHLSTAEGLAVELDEFVACFDTEDKREGTTAFLEKRAAKFIGR